MNIPFNYGYEITIYFQLSDEDFGFITLMMKNHYDHSVKSACEKGGFWYGNMNQVKLQEYDKEHNIGPYDRWFIGTTRQLQLVVKALEPYAFIGDSDKWKKQNDLYDAFYKMVSDAINHANDLTKAQEVKL